MTLLNSLAPFFDASNAPSGLARCFPPDLRAPARVFAPLARAGALRLVARLDLACSGALGDDALRALVGLPSDDGGGGGVGGGRRPLLPNLRVLDLAFCPRITNAGVEALDLVETRSKAHARDVSWRRAYGHLLPSSYDDAARRAYLQNY